MEMMGMMALLKVLRAALKGAREMEKGKDFLMGLVKWKRVDIAHVMHGKKLPIVQRQEYPDVESVQSAENTKNSKTPIKPINSLSNQQITTSFPQITLRKRRNPFT